MMNQFSRAIGGFFLDIIETVVIALSIFLIVYLFIMQPHQVNGSSMFPTYEDGQYLLTDKISYKTGVPKRGDVIVFKAPDSAGCPEGTGCDFIKRIIGLPGDLVEIKDDGVYVNNQLLTEAYLPSTTVTRAGNFTINGAVRVPDNSYFVMGDNRNHSSDSRIWGTVNKNLIVGKVFFRYWPPQAVSLIQSVSYQGF
jgi:signal peptidase I